MDNSFASQTYGFKLKCPKCQKKVKELLSRLNGVHSVRIEGDAGRVTVKSSVDLKTLAAAIEEVMKGQKYSCEGLTPPLPPNEEENKNHMPHESNSTTGPSHIGVDSMPHCAEIVVNNYGGPYYDTYYSYHNYQVAMPPYHAYYHHCYPPPSYYGYQIMQPPRMPPLLAKVNTNMAHLSCHYSSKCRIM